MTDTITHITTSGGLITQTFIDNIRQPATRQPGTEPASFQIHGRGPKSPADLEADIAAAWELLKERWDAVHDEIHEMSVSDVRARWLIPLFQVLDFDPQYQRGDTIIADTLRFDLSHRGWPPDKYAIRNTQYAIPPILHTVAPTQDLDQRAGSYYTHPSLVNELIRSALLPVMRDRLAGAGLPVAENTDDSTGTARRAPTTGLLTDYAGLTDAQRIAGEEALLNITVCDPAAGSGHFLVKANNVLGADLARIRTGDEYPSERDVQAAKRDVLAECIYAVDLNPMAVELCKVSLWINASVADRPLSFLDHHIKCGNSLIGATPELLDDGVPADAFALGRPGDDRAMAREIRARNRQERRDYEQGGGYHMQFRVTLIETMEDLRAWAELRDLATDAPKMARERYAEYITSEPYRLKKLEADFWAAAFFWPMPEGADWAPTFGEFMRLRHEGPEALPAERLAQISALADKHKFFHWHLEFEEVFQTCRGV